MAIIENKYSSQNITQVCQQINPLWFSLHNLNKAPYGKILLIWNPTIFQPTPLLLTD